MASGRREFVSVIVVGVCGSGMVVLKHSAAEDMTTQQKARQDTLPQHKASHNKTDWPTDFGAKTKPVKLCHSGEGILPAPLFPSPGIVNLPD